MEHTTEYIKADTDETLSVSTGMQKFSPSDISSLQTQEYAYWINPATNNGITKYTEVWESQINSIKIFLLCQPFSEICHQFTRDGQRVKKKSMNISIKKCHQMYVYLWIITNFSSSSIKGIGMKTEKIADYEKNHETHK